MLKFLRKYNKIILAVFGSVLMVVFLVPQAIQQFGGNPASQPVATLAGEKISRSELGESTTDIRILSDIEPNMLGLLGLQEPAAEHWLLLTRLAEQGGFVGGPQDGQNFIDTAARTFVDLQRRQIAAQYGADIASQLFPAEQIEQRVDQLKQQMNQRRVAAVSGAGTTEQRVNMTLARANAIVRMYETYLNSSQLSTMESIALARRFFDTAVVDYTIVPARAAYDEIEPPTPEEIQRHFEQYRDVAPGEGEHGFGYLRQPAIRYEWLLISPATFEDQIDISRIDVVTQYKRGEDTTYADMSREEALAQIEQELRQERVQEIMELAVNTAQAEILKATQTLESEGRFKILPEDWPERRAPYDVVARKINEAVQTQFDIESEPATARPAGPFFTRQGAQQTSELAAAQLRSGTRQIPWVELAFSVRALNEESPYGLQVGLTGPPLQDSQSNVYFFRVVEARPESPPESIAEVRTDVVEDLRNLKAYRIIKERAPSYREQAAASLEALAEQVDSDIRREITVGLTGMENAQGRAVSAIFNTEEVRNAIMARADAIDPREGEFQQTDPMDLTLVVALDQTMSLAVVKITSVEPISLENYRALEPRVRVDFQEIGDPYGGDSPFSFEELSQRFDFERLERGDGPTEPGDEASGQQGPATPFGPLG